MYGNIMHIAYVNWLEEHGVPVPVPPGPTPVPPGPTPEPSPYPQDWVLLRFVDPNVDPTGHGNLVRWEKKTDSAYNDWYLRIGSAKRDAQHFYEYLLVEYQEDPDVVVTKSGNDVTVKFPHNEEYPVTQDDANEAVDRYIGEGVLASGSTATPFVGDEMDGIIFHCAEANEVYPGYRIGPEALYYEAFRGTGGCTLVGNVLTVVLPKMLVEMLEQEMGIALNTDSLNSMLIPMFIAEGMILEGTTGTVTFETIGDEEFVTMTIEGPSGEFIPDDTWEPNLDIGDDMKFEIIDDDWTYSYMDTGLFIDCTGLTAIKSTFSKLTDGSYMFYGCSGLTSIPENLCPNLTDGSYMFHECTGLTNIPENLCPNLTEGSNMFSGCTGLTSIPESLFPNLTEGSWMFNGCTGLTNIPENLCPNLTEGSWMFKSCGNVKTGIYELYTFLSGTGKVTGHQGMFRNCGNNTEEGRAALAMIPSDWK